MDLRELDSIHPRSSVSRIYLLRNHGGRGLLSLEYMHDRLVSGIVCEIPRSAVPLQRLVRQHKVANAGVLHFKAAEQAALVRF